jgi:hypothetical protein
MTSRFISNMTVLLLGAFLIAASLAFHTDVLGWLGLAVGALVVATVLGAFVARGRGAAQRALDACVLLTGAWTIVASRSFAGVDLKWLSFSSGAVMVLFAFVGLIVHEVLMELALRRPMPRFEDGRVTTVPAARPPVRVAR